MLQKQALTCIFLLILALAPMPSMAVSSNDPGYYQWGLEDTGVYEAWGKATGSKEVIVAIVDNGFDTFHPDLYQNAWKNEDEIEDNGMDDDQNGYIDDVWGWNFVYKDLDGDGRLSDDEIMGNNNPRPDVLNLKLSNSDSLNVIHHGTLVAGIIGASGNNTFGMSGINWDVKLMNLKAVDEEGNGHSGSLVDAIRYAINNGADIINVSMVSGIVDDRIYDLVKEANEKGIAIVAAAGNNQRMLEKDNGLYPVCADAGSLKPLILGVSAISEDHRKAVFSNFGSDCIDITAPGVNITSTMRYAPGYGLTESYSGGWNGTSFATPFVSGVLALVKSIQPTWGADLLYEAVLKTVHKTPPEDEELYTHLFGSGLLQAQKAVAYALERLPKISKGKTMTFVNLKSGLLEFRDVKGNINSVAKEVLKDKSDLAAFANGENVFATLRSLNGVLTVGVFDSNWVLKSSFKITQSGEFGLVLADVSGDSEPEIILYPKKANKNVFYVYSQKGELLKTVSASFTHSGVSLNVLRGFAKNKIIAVYKNEDGSFSIKQFDENFVVGKDIPLSFFKVVPSLAAGDIDGDGAEEIVVASGAGQEPFIAFYEQDGVWKRLFYGRELSYTKGFSVETADFNADGKEDIILSSLADAKITVWNGQAKKITEFTAFQNKGIGLNKVLLSK